MSVSKEAAMSRKIQFVCLFVLLGLLSLATQPGFAQSPLNFGNNFFVTGDYIVAGAYGMTTNFKTTNGVSYAVGTINVPDTNPGIQPGVQGEKQVPPGAQIVAALLYWQTVEKVGVKPGAPGSGQNGYFRPLLYSTSGGPAAPGYAISGTNVSASANVSWSSGGCTGASTGKLLRTYRADVVSGLPVDVNGNSVANGSFEVRLPSVGNATPLTLGATLVVIYRLPSGAGGPNIPLNSIVIYDGDYAQGSAQLTMTQQLQGFYDADHNPVSRLTHIVGNGKSNKFQTVYLGSGKDPLVPPTFVPLPSLYGKQLPPFPGYYVTWDNPTWTFTSASQNPSNPVTEDSIYATTQVVPSTSNQGCVSWGAVIVSTTVKNPDNDGILYSWKDNQGYCDVALNPSCNKGDPAWVDLTGAAHNQQDVFLQYDYMCSSMSSGSCGTGGSNYSFDPRLATDPADGLTAIEKVVNSYANLNGSSSHHTPIVLHAVPGNAIEENQPPNISCLASDLTCPFPNEPGTIGFSAGLTYIKNQTIDTQTGLLGCGAADPTCVPVFQHGKKDSYHYALFSHGVGVPNWFLLDGSLSPVTQKGNTVTFTTSLPHGIAQIVQNPKFASATDTSCPSGRVTVLFAITNSNLNGTFCAQNVTSTTFQITVPGSPTTKTVTYTSETDPNLAVANGQVTSMSGYSDVGGQNSVIALGYGGWGPPSNSTSDGNKWQVKAGTLHHELGHTMALTHGGTFLNNLTNNDYTPTYEANCKPNLQTSMSYLFQFDLLEVPGTLNSLHQPLMVVDYSEETLPTLTKGSPQLTGVLNSTFYDRTAWFQLTSYAGSTLTLSSAANAAGGSTVYAGTITGGGGNALAGLTFIVAGFTNGANNGTFVSTASTTTTLTLSNASGVAETHAATANTTVSPHCDGTPLKQNDLYPYTYVTDLTSNFFWSNITGLDINFDGNSTDTMHGHNEWEGTPAEGEVGPSPGLDLRQVSALGTITTTGSGGAGGLKPGGGASGLYQVGGGSGLKPGGGGLKPGGGGLKPGGGSSAEITHEAANSYARPPRDLVIVQEEASPRYIDLSWFVPTFGTVVNYNIYRSAAGAAFTLLTSVPGSQTTFQDTVTCNAGGYRYRVTAVTTNDAGQPQESSPSNIVPASTDPKLTGCYTVNPFSVPANVVQGSPVQVTWTLTDDFFETPPASWSSATPGNPVPRQAAITSLFVVSIDCNSSVPGPRTQLYANGAPVNGADSFTPSGNTYTFTWNNTDNFSAGCYNFELDLDSGQAVTSSTLTLGIDINDKDNPNITTLSLPDATAYVAYNPPALTEDGGVGAITWSISAGALPTGITLGKYTGAFSGFAVLAGTYNFTVMATDSKGNTGTRAFSLVVHIFVSGTPPVGSPPFTANPALPDATVGTAYSQPVTEEGGTPAFTWNITGSFPSGISQQASSATISGTACVVGSYNLSASVIDSQSNTGMQALTLQVDKGSTTTGVTSNANPSVFQQMVTFTVTVAPQYGCTPTGTVTLSDGVTLIASSNLPLSGIATFTTSALSVGVHSITARYSGDSNFNSSTSGVSQTVNPAPTQIVVNSVSPPTAFVGQPITVSYTFSVVAPGAGSPIPPSGNITVSASGGAGSSSCMAAALQGAGMCTLSPPPTTAGVNTYTITYAGDGNFVGSGANGNYTVYQLVFTTQPSNTVVGLTITPAVVVTAEDSTSATLTTFTGGITVAIGSGPGALSGTTTQNAVAGVATFGDLSINKVAIGDTLTASPSGGVPDATSNPFNIDTYYVDGSGNFGTLDLASGTATQIAAGTAPSSSGMDLTPGLLVYEYNTTSNQLIEITPSTGAATPVGSAGSIPDQATAGALTDGSYFGIDMVTGILYSINLTTGLTTSVGTTTTALVPAGCSFEASLTGSASANVLYYTIGSTGVGTGCTAFTDTLYQINPTSGATTPIGQVTVSGSGVNAFVGSTFVGGTLYGFASTSGGQEYTIDPGTGVATFLKNTTVPIIGAGSSQ
jgi:Bacterial Ig-like domain (group 3)/Putative Ig domain